MILKYDFEDGTGTVVTDTSGNSMNGTLVDADWTANTDGRNGIAGEFVNADSAVALPNDVFAGASELTVTAWVFMTDNQQWNHLFDIGTGTDNDLYFTFNNENGGMELGLRLNGNAPQTLFTTTMLPLNVWKHVAITLSSKGAFMYVDGREVARAAGLVISPSVLGVTTSNWIGKSQFPYPEFSGRIDEFYMYKRALTKSEIAMLAWPKLYYSIWHFDETGEMRLDFLHPGATLDEVRATLGWTPHVSASLAPTPVPTEEELRLIRDELDPEGMYTK